MAQALIFTVPKVERERERGARNTKVEYVIWNERKVQIPHSSYYFPKAPCKFLTQYELGQIQIFKLLLPWVE